MEFPGSQLLLQLVILQEQPRQPSFQAGPGRNAVLYKKMDYKNLGSKQPKDEEHSPHIEQKNGKGGQYYTAAVLQRQPNARKWTAWNVLRGMPRRRVSLAASLSKQNTRPKQHEVSTAVRADTYNLTRSP
jgi:hypothetical protein